MGRLINWLVKRRLAEREAELAAERLLFHRDMEQQRILLHEDAREQRQQFLDALAGIAAHFALGQQATATQVAKLAEASMAHAQALNSHLSLFTADSLPVSRTIRDEDEFFAEAARSAFPDEATPQDQLRWVLANT